MLTTYEVLVIESQNKLAIILMALINDLLPTVFFTVLLVESSHECGNGANIKTFRS